ncbi:MAG: 4-alpha-glucanotransferase [Candidatus Gastranaerophilales bacterium]|nr:4-alpha-glucanotransferase [Candidatus Gastranaerophilales bacterium]
MQTLAQSFASPSFGRRLRGDEISGCQNAVREGLDTLDKNLAIILPTTCSPSETKKDVGIGQPYSDISSKKLYPFLAQFGYTKQQKQPAGLGKLTDASPYVSNSSAYNTAIIDLSKLTEPKMGAILSKDTYNSIVNNNPKKGTGRCAYIYNQKAHREALSEAYQTFKYKKEHVDSLSEQEKTGILKLDSEFSKFKELHGEEQEKNALYSILTDINGNDYWPNWSSEVDRNLFSTKGNRTSQNKRNERLNELRTDYSNEIDSFLFSQMLAKKTIDNGNRVMEKNGISGIGDIPVAFSDAEVWGNKDLFLDEYRMGCKEPWSEQPQKWGFFVLDPSQLFNNDGTLGNSGQFLYDKYSRAFNENKGGVRIDHIVGLMDPYVYSIKDNKEGRLYSEIYKGANGENCDRILNEIVLRAAGDTGLGASNIIAEDLGYMPGNTMQTLKDMGIGGVTVTQWTDSDQVRYAPSKNTAMVGNHDTASAKELYPDNKVRKNKFVELFSSGAKNIQIFWTDMFGIKERYNQPGVSGDQNWSLRMTENFENDYYKAAENNEALNIPEVILEANRRKNSNFDRKHKELAGELQKYSGILHEKE